MSQVKNERKAPPPVKFDVVFFSENGGYLATEQTGMPAKIKTDEGAAAWLKASKRWRHEGGHMFAVIPGIGPVFVPAGQK